MDPNIEDIEKQQQSNFIFQSLSSLLFHPVEYVKVLCQLGHEPIPPRLGKSIFGTPKLVLPNVFQYIKHIKRTDGLTGCFNGLLPTFLGNLASVVFPTKVIKTFELTYIIEDPPNILNDDEVQSKEYINFARREITMHAISVVVSHPFRVITVRMMASFVGNEEGYKTMTGAVASIYRDSGLSGFFAGLAPRLVGDLTCIGASVVLAYYINKYFVKQKEARGYVIPTCLFVVSTVTYPFTVVSTCMAVNGSSLMAGNPPRMPIYSSWQNCLFDLIARKQHKRGGSLIFRYQS